MKIKVQAKDDAHARELARKAIRKLDGSEVMVEMNIIERRQ
jgi:hypothetical protein